MTLPNGSSAKTKQNAALAAAEKALDEAQAAVDEILHSRDNLVAEDLHAAGRNAAIADANERLRAACLRRDQRRVEWDRVRNQGAAWPSADFHKLLRLRYVVAARHREVLLAIDRRNAARRRVGELNGAIAEAEDHARRNIGYGGNDVDWARRGQLDEIPDHRRRMAELAIDLERAKVEAESATIAERAASEAWGQAKNLVDSCEAAIRELPGGPAALKALADPRFGGDTPWALPDGQIVQPRDPRPKVEGTFAGYPITNNQG